MGGSLEREILAEIERLEGKVERLREFLDEEKGTGGKSARELLNAGPGAGGEEDLDERAQRRIQAGVSPSGGVRGVTPSRGQPAITEMSDEDLLQMLTDAPTNKNGSIDLRTDIGRTLRGVGLVDENGFPTEDAERLSGGRQTSSGRRRMKAGRR